MENNHLLRVYLVFLKVKNLVTKCKRTTEKGKIIPKTVPKTLDL